MSRDDQVEPVPPADEPWEEEVASALAALPSVEPPAGFLAHALDHRPLYAGRTLLALVAGVVAAIALTLGGDLTERTAVVVDVSAFSATLAANDVAPGDGDPATGGPDGDGQGGAGVGAGTPNQLERLVDAMVRQLGFPAPGGRDG